MLNSEMKVASQWWWLRSPGGNKSRISIIDRYGESDYYGISADSSGGVRPAITVKVNK